MSGFEGARVRAFEVVPSLPEQLKPLLEIAYNLWWTWQPEAIDLFVRLDRDLWHRSGHNPVLMLGTIDQQTLDTAAHDDGYVTSLQHVGAKLQRHLQRTPWHETAGHDLRGKTLAYFCAEFGLAECLQVYSGGLGCLAGDHLKSASELGLPLIAVGLLYRHGYFQQYLNADGWQQERVPNLDFTNLPIEEVKLADGPDAGQTVKVRVPMAGHDVAVALWKCNVGRVPLYLLDTNLPENRPEDRDITSQLYGGDMETRIRQEIVLGIGGVRALEAIGVRPDVCHMNEGHSAFLALERIRRLIEDHRCGFDDAREQAAASHVFTTHTPVPAGIDRFPPSLIERYFAGYVSGLKLDMEGLLSLGRENVFNRHEAFSMAVLAIRTSRFANGVSKLHGEVSRQMWKPIWPGIPENEVPIGHVTNGVHARTWLSSELAQMLNRYLGSKWQNNPADQSVWQAIHEVPDEELWRLHERQRQKLIVWARRTLRHQLQERGIAPHLAKQQLDGLSDSILTIGFARRFATYKRGNLILRDPDRLKRLLADAKRPIQFLIAGKAHPADGGGKALIQQLVKFSAESDAGHRVVFIENYDMHVARRLVQGCDIWLNTPVRGMEASGTSGMKAALNGVLNCSILDGWWDEAYQSALGWAIGRRETYQNPDVGDDIESRALYDLLENQIVPLFYQRNEQGIPHEWVARMKRCIGRLAPVFNTNRMVQQYAEQYYVPSAARAGELAADALAMARTVAAQTHKLRRVWPTLAVEQVDVAVEQPLGVGEARPITVTARLGELAPEEVRVQAYTGRLDTDGKLCDGAAADLQHVQPLGDGRHSYRGQITSPASGRFGVAVRIVPGGPLARHVLEPGLILWEGREEAAKRPSARRAQPVGAA